MTFLFFESVSCQSTFNCSSASRASAMPLKKSLLLAANPVSALFKFFATRWADFQNGLFFGFFGSSALSARAFLIIAAAAFLALWSNDLASAFCPVSFFCAVLAVALSALDGDTARATANTLSDK